MAAGTYVLTWLSIAVILAATAPLAQKNAWASWLVVVVAAVGLIDIITAQLGITLFDRVAPDHAVEGLARSVVLGFINILELPLLFGAASACLQSLFLGSFVFSPQPQTVLDFIYMAWGQMLTVGSRFSPVTGGAEVIHMLEVGSGLLLIGITLSVFVGNLRLRERGEAVRRSTSE